MRIETQNSVYRLDTLAKTWERTKISQASGDLRTESGTYLDVVQLEVGRSMVLACPPINNDSTVRVLVTSTVKWIDQFADELSPRMVAMLEEMARKGDVGQA